MARRTTSGSSTPQYDDTSTRHIPQDRAVADQRTGTEHTTGAHEPTVHAQRTARTGPVAHSGHVEAKDRFGGTNWGSAFFGWLVAVGLTIILTGIVGAIVAGISDSTEVTQNQAQRQAGTIGIVAAVVLLVVLAISYYAGGYVAGRMSRFDGGRQGLGVWIIGLVVTLVAIGLGALFGNQYNIFDRVNLPRIPVSTDQLSTGGVITAVLVLVLTLLLAMAGGKMGQRYHNKVDRVAHG